MSTATPEREAFGTQDEGTALDAVRRIEHHTRTLDRNVRLTQMADGKAAPALALQATLAAFAATQAEQITNLFKNGSPPEAVLAAIFLGVYVLGATAAWYQSAMVYLPRAPKPGIRTHHGQSIVYFDDIQAMALEEFHARSLSINAGDLESDLIQQTHVVAGIAAEKLHRVQLAYVASGVALLGWVAIVLLARA